MATSAGRLLVGCCCALAMGAHPARTAGAATDPKSIITTPPTLSQEEELRQGGIVVHHVNRHPIYHLDVYGMIEAPFDTVWGAVTSFDEYHQFLPLVVESGIRRRHSGSTWQYVKMQPPWPLHAHWMVNINVENRSSGIVSWTMADGNLRFERGYWHMRSYGANRTRLQYHLTVDPWLDIVPGWLIEFGTRQVLPNVIKGVRQRVKQSFQKGFSPPREEGWAV
jgi:ribosome-associated toxin RatA of RatAB toxin-antitoxin module